MTTAGMTTADMQNQPRSLAGANILQLVPALRDDALGRTANDIASMLLQSGARAIIAGDGGPLVGELRALGGEWLPMPIETFNPFQIRSNIRALVNLIAAERVDIVHAHSGTGAWSAIRAIGQSPVYLVTSFGDRPGGNRWPRSAFNAAVAQGRRIIAPSSYVSLAMIERYRIAADRIAVIPRAIDTATFSPVAVSAERIAALRRTWGVLPDMRLVVIAGRVAPWNGQIAIVDVARLIVGGGERNIAFVFAGDDAGQSAYTKALRRRALIHDIDTLCRFPGHCPDLPAAFGAADVVVVPALEPPLTGRLVAEAQAMGRPVVAAAVGALPENLLAPPRMSDELRTGWLVRPGDAAQFAHAVTAALALDVTAHEALGARARQFAEFAFSPQSVAAAVRGVYTSLLSRAP